ncbi:hypothetical protein ACWEP3_16235, partial [Streptomyces albidoflavus]
MAGERGLVEVRVVLLGDVVLDGGRASRRFGGRGPLLALRSRRRLVATWTPAWVTAMGRSPADLVYSTRARTVPCL